MLKKIFKEIGRFALVATLYSLYCIAGLWLRSLFVFDEIIGLIIFPILVALCFWKYSRMWLVDLIIIILLYCVYINSIWPTVFPTIS